MPLAHHSSQAFEFAEQDFRADSCAPDHDFEVFAVFGGGVRLALRFHWFRPSGHHVRPFSASSVPRFPSWLNSEAG
jgi:hypothetical protein